MWPSACIPASPQAAPSFPLRLDIHVLAPTSALEMDNNIGRITAAFGTVFFGLFSTVGIQSRAADHRLALLYAAFLFLPAAATALCLPRVRD